MKCTLDTHITSVFFNWNDVSFKDNAQTIDFVTSQFTFELLGLVLHPFSNYTSTINCFLL